MLDKINKITGYSYLVIVLIATIFALVLGVRVKFDVQIYSCFKGEII